MPNRKSEYRDMNKFKETRYKQRLRYYRRFQNAPNKGARWSDEDINLVLAHEFPDRELSKLLGRSIASIQICRARHKEVENKDE